MNTAFWAGKRVLLTGHTGFKGSWLSIWLRQLDAGVIGVALPPPTSPSLFEDARVSDGMISVMTDIRDFTGLNAVFDKHRPDIIIHMAAQSLVRESYASPRETYDVNLMGTVNVLECARRTGSVQATLIVTTDKVYENKGSISGYRENDELGGHDPYSNSKACAELAASAYRRSFFGPDGRGSTLATARAGNVIGGGDWAKDRLIPDIMKAVMNDEPVQIRYPDAVRPWQHVLEPLNGYLMLVEALATGDKAADAWNFGPDDGDVASVRTVVEGIEKRLDGRGKWMINDAATHHEAAYLGLNCAKARDELGWHPKLDLATTLDWTVDWYRAYWQNKSSALDVCLNQLRMFSEMK